MYLFLENDVCNRKYRTLIGNDVLLVSCKVSNDSDEMRYSVMILLLIRFYENH